MSLSETLILSIDFQKTILPEVEKGATVRVGMEAD